MTLKEIFMHSQLYVNQAFFFSVQKKKKLLLSNKTHDLLLQSPTKYGKNNVGVSDWNTRKKQGSN